MRNANNYFGSTNGSESFYRHNPSLIHYTKGVKDMAEKCEAYWLIDLIISHQIKSKVKLETFQVRELTRVKNNAFTINATDGNNNKVTGQNIPFSDFPYNSATLWLVNGCLMLPCEY